jgi:hypothetical protein
MRVALIALSAAAFLVSGLALLAQNPAVRPPGVYKTAAEK